MGIVGSSRPTASAGNSNPDWSPRTDPKKTRFVSLWQFRRVGSGKSKEKRAANRGATGPRRGAPQSHRRDGRSHRPGTRQEPEELAEAPGQSVVRSGGSALEVGWVQNVIVNKTTGNLIDGHARVAIAEKHGDQRIPVVYVELTPAEEDLVLATLDPLGDLAAIDNARLQELLSKLDPQSAALASLIADLEAELGIGGEETPDPETLLDQAVQLEPAKEYIVIVCNEEDRVGPHQGATLARDRPARRVQARFSLRRNQHRARHPCAPSAETPGGVNGETLCPSLRASCVGR